jgi:hypothetical protein
VELAERQERKRPAEGALLEESADVKRRNKRLFGAILGTLQRFRWASSWGGRTHGEVAARECALLSAFEGA